ncbi:glutathione synthase [Thermoleptolyngbya oregonensis NK1-22]|uniref:Glutathione synthetase n=1 Tax=Thermoleptolyngbya oregonensis NK1-22 TaxID=2547457 RepID=A0AA96YMU2_9CYAN|nr:glutathione synthase [Thermoleptolyngbya oregonensis]WOB43072.1 glutathione synthase [Thermoleptolyngbya oregonensis NK1-22]
MKLAFIIDPIHRLDPGHDTSVALMEAAQQMGHEVWITEANRLSVVGGRAYAQLQPVRLVPVELVEGRWVAAEVWFELGDRQFLPLDSLDAVFMRTDPPVDIPYLYATYVLDYVNPDKTWVINAPAGLRAANEKMYALQFTGAIPETIVTADKQVIREFVERQGAAVMKPLGGKAGEGILFAEPGDRNLNSLIEISTQQFRVPIMVQEYLPAAKDGDKRVILLNGEPIGAVNRIPTGKEFRGNMAVGGRVAAVEITERDRQICAQLAPTLRRDGLIFVGIDIIGGYLTEVNVTSPTGIREIDRLNDVRLGQQVMDWLSQSRGIEP